MPNPLFFIALLPSREIQDETTAFKLECARLFGASHALNSPPHVTLQAPFRWPLEQLDELQSTLTEFANGQMSFAVALKDFSCFRPRVLFVGVEKGKSLLELQEKLANHLLRKLALKDKRSRRFHPHLTIAHRDLKEADFPAAWKHFSKKSYQRHFPAKGLYLLRHQGGKWEVIDEFKFNAGSKSNAII